MVHKALVLSLLLIAGFVACDSDRVLAQAAPTAGRPGGGWGADVKPARSVASAITLGGGEDRVLLTVTVSKPIAASIFTLAEPFRVIVDVADLDFQIPATTGTTGRGVVAGFRYGQFEGGKSRIVIDAKAPIRIENGQFRPGLGREPGRLSFEIVRISLEAFTALAGGQAGGQPAEKSVPAVKNIAVTEPPAAAGPAPGKDVVRARPIVVIDPGHGGIDPGTVASGSLTEKAVVLAVARQLKVLLQQTKRYDVHMTREDDVFVSLDKRVQVSRQRGADLFISIHADSLAEKDLAQNVRGASIYTLSDRASDETARKLAEKENAADLLAGLDAVPASDEDNVRNILLDLMGRETGNFSAEFRNILVENMKGKTTLSKDPRRSAAFKVLKQASTPAVLIELGYMSNAEDLARLSKADWQRQIATALAASVDRFFASRIKGVQR